MSTPKVKIEKLNDQELKNARVFNWPIWEKEPSEFDWYYDTTEKCYFLEGEVVVVTDQGDFTIKKGDFVTFAQGLSCRWIVKQKVRKHYNFD